MSIDITNFTTDSSWSHSQRIFCPWNFTKM